MTFYTFCILTLYTVKMYCNISHLIKRPSVVGFLSARTAAMPHSETESVWERGGGASCSPRRLLRTRFYISMLLKCLGTNAIILPKTWKSHLCCCSSLWQFKPPRVAELATLRANPLCPVNPNTGRTGFSQLFLQLQHLQPDPNLHVFRLESNERESPAERCRRHIENNLLFFGWFGYPATLLRNYKSHHDEITDTMKLCTWDQKPAQWELKSVAVLNVCSLPWIDELHRLVGRRVETRSSSIALPFSFCLRLPCRSV